MGFQEGIQLRNQSSFLAVLLEFQQTRDAQMPGNHQLHLILGFELLVWFLKFITNFLNLIFFCFIFLEIVLFLLLWMKFVTNAFFWCIPGYFPLIFFLNFVIWIKLSGDLMILCIKWGSLSTLNSRIQEGFLSIQHLSFSINALKFQNFHFYKLLSIIIMPFLCFSMFLNDLFGVDEYIMHEFLSSWDQSVVFLSISEVIFFFLQDQLDRVKRRRVWMNQIKLKLIKMLYLLQVLLVE